MKIVDCKDCQGYGGHATYEEDVQDLVAHICPTCNGEGVIEQ
jgi:DnaJ-class molecular chaperone